MTATTEEPAEVRAPRRKRWAAVGLFVVLVAVAVLFLFGTRDARLSFDLEGPAEPVRPGGEVTIRAPDAPCGPLIVTLHDEAILGFWDRTHSGDVIGGFTRDERAWWSLGGDSTMTPVPCSVDEEVTFTLPEDVPSGAMAACDQGGNCARFRVAD